MLQNLDKVVRTAIVAKINLEKDLDPILKAFGFYPNINDCFLISSLFSERMTSDFIPPKSETITISPIEGDKLIGTFRDKGSVTGVLRRCYLICKYRTKSSEEAKRLAKAISQINGGKVKIVNETIVTFPIDIVANPSTGRDNVLALTLQSCMEFKGILEDKTFEMSIDEVQNINIEEILNEREYSHDIDLMNMNGKVLYTFKEVPILIEDFFWQPKHSNRFSLREKEVSLNYHQAIDGMQTIVPELYNTMLNSINIEKIKESILALGLEIKEDSQLADIINNNTQSNCDDEDEWEL